MQTESDYIKDLIAQGEHGQLDFKFEISNARKIAKTCSSFANTSGGRLLIGVKDNGNIAGVKSDEEYYMIESAAQLYCKPEVPFKSYQRKVDGRTILEIVIPPSKEKPVVAEDESGKWIAYVRVNDENLVADYIQLQVWKRENNRRGTWISYSENEERVLEYLRTHREPPIATVRSEIPMRNRVINQVVINLVLFKVVDMVYRDNQLCLALHDDEAR